MISGISLGRSTTKESWVPARFIGPDLHSLDRIYRPSTVSPNALESAIGGVPRIIAPKRIHKAGVAD